MSCINLKSVNWIIQNDPTLTVNVSATTNDDRNLIVSKMKCYTPTENCVINISAAVKLFCIFSNMHFYLFFIFTHRQTGFVNARTILQMQNLMGSTMIILQPRNPFRRESPWNKSISLITHFSLQSASVKTSKKRSRVDVN